MKKSRPASAQLSGPDDSIFVRNLKQIFLHKLFPSKNILLKVVLDYVHIISETMEALEMKTMKIET